jgi:hypothetical protein
VVYYNDREIAVIENGANGNFSGVADKVFFLFLFLFFVVLEFEFQGLVPLYHLSHAPV